MIIYLVLKLTSNVTETVIDWEGHGAPEKGTGELGAVGKSEALALK